MIFTVPVEGGDDIEFECDDTFASRWVCQAILEDTTYPHLPFVGDVEVILDVGANCGATTVHLARHHPRAVVHAFEPGRDARGYLERNVAAYPNVVVHPFGLGDADRDDVPLFHAQGDIGSASVLARPTNDQGDFEPIQLRDAGAWAAAEGIDHVDILKVDVEGLEVVVLESLAALLPTVKVLYVEYDSRADRRRIMAMLDDTHELYLALLMTLDQGECVFLRKDLADVEGARDRLVEIYFGARRAAAAAAGG